MFLSLDLYARSGVGKGNSILSFTNVKVNDDETVTTQSPGIEDGKSLIIIYQYISTRLTIIVKTLEILFLGKVY
jgi:hypothetical protein